MISIIAVKYPKKVNRIKENFKPTVADLKLNAASGVATPVTRYIYNVARRVYYVNGKANVWYFRKSIAIKTKSIKIINV